MSVFPSSALTTSQYDKLRGTTTTPPRWHGAVYASVCPNTVVYSARVNGTPSGTSFAQVDYDTGAGTLSNVRTGMTVFFSAENDIRSAYFVGRVRKTPTSSVLYINETSAEIADDDYIFIVDDYRIWPRLARESSGVHYKDYDLTYQGLPPVVVGLQQAYAGFVSPTTNKLRLAFSVSSSYAAESGASISSYSWSFPSSATLVSGSLTSSACTMDFSPSTGVWCSVTVTDNGGRSQTRRFFVHAAERDGVNAPVRGISGAAISGDLANGWTATIDAFEGVSTLLDNTLVVLWSEEAYNGQDGALVAGTDDPRNVVFVGRVARDSAQGQSDAQYSYLTSTRLDCEGVGAQLARLHGGLISMLWDAAPDVYDEVKNLTVWRAVVHFLHFHSTVLTLCDLTFDDTSNTFQIRGLTTQGGSLLNVVNDIAEGINAALEFAPAGAMRVVRDPNYLSDAARNALTVHGAFGVQDYIAVSIDVDNVQRVGRVDGSGGTFDAANVSVTPLLSVAPGMANDYPEAASQLGRQILQSNVSQSAAQNELNARTGHHLAKLNGEAALNVSMPDGYGFLVPTVRNWYTWTLDNTSNNRGRAYTSTTRWLLTAVNYQYDNAAGTRTVQASFAQETKGSPGDTVQYPAPGDIPSEPGIDIPPIDIGIIPTDPIEGGGTNPGDSTGDGPWIVRPRRKDGNIVMIWNASSVYLTTDFLSTNPSWADITPPGGYTIVAAAFAPDFRGGAYVLMHDGTNSRVAYTSNAIGRTVTWTIGAAVSGIYTELRGMSTPGRVAIYSPDPSSGSTWSETFDFVLNNGGWTANPTFGASYSAGVGWSTVDHTSLSAARRTVDIVRSVSSCTVTGFTVTYDLTKGTYPSPTPAFAAGYNSDVGTQFWLLDDTDLSSGTNLTQSWTGNVSGVTQLRVGLNSSVDNTPPLDSFSGAALIKYVTVTGTGSNPFASGSGNAVARFSASYGAAFGSEVVVGVSPGTSGGFDVVRVGNHSFGAANNQVKVATTAGGAYSDAAGGALTGVQPSLLFVPLFDWGSGTVRNTTANYDCLFGADGLDSGHCLWRVDGAGVKTGITPSGVTAIPTNNCAFTWKGTHMALIGNASGTRKLFTSSTIGSTDAWTDRGALGANANSIKIRRTSRTGQHLFWVDGASVAYRSSFSATTVTKAYPDTATLLGLDVYG